MPTDDRRRPNWKLTAAAPRRSGDMFHLDLSYTARQRRFERAQQGLTPRVHASSLRLRCAQAFDVIADRSKGVVDLVWRQVDCATRKNSVTTY